MVEAMSLGLVPIATAISSVPEIIRDRESGVLITPDPESLCQALAWLCADPERTAAVGANAREFARANFDARKNFAQFDAMYSALLGAQ
jgi:glycosyltransferase involved in cell wall biosynthesis